MGYDTRPACMVALTAAPLTCFQRREDLRQVPNLLQTFDNNDQISGLTNSQLHNERLRCRKWEHKKGYSIK